MPFSHSNLSCLLLLLYQKRLVLHSFSFTFWVNFCFLFSAFQRPVLRGFQLLHFSTFTDSGYSSPRRMIFLKSFGAVFFLSIAVYLTLTLPPEQKAVPCGITLHSGGSFLRRYAIQLFGTAGSRSFLIISHSAFSSSASIPNCLKIFFALRLSAS